ncbi:GHKL domain-containing protein [Lachnospiraceae bacterium KH1T2]|nr:GHKL domain-containing protein [Lachnospiraceae bacterium KH1T2]
MKDIMVINTPGIYYAAAYWISFTICGAISMYKSFSEKKDFVKGLIVHSLPALVILSAYMVLTDGKSKAAFVPLMLLTIAGLCIYIKILKKCSAEEAVYHAARAFLVGEFMASFGWQVYFYLFKMKKVSWSIPSQVLLALPIYILIAVIMILLENKSYEEDIEIDKKRVFPVMIIAAAAFFISNMGYIYGETPFSSGFSEGLFIIRTNIDLAGLSMLYVYHWQLAQLNSREKLSRLENIMAMQHANYKISEETVALINRKYHDIKHQIAILRMENRGENFDASLRRIENEIKSYEAQNKTGNEALDIILTAKSLLCQKDGIELTVVADGEALGFMDDLDLASLFGNALDNAIEGALEVQNEEERLIHVSVSRKKAFLVIRVENRYMGDIKFVNGMPVTKKKDKRYHGYGTQSIRSVVEKYGGSVNFDAKDEWFKLNILIPQ